MVEVAADGSQDLSGNSKARISEVNLTELRLIRNVSGAEITG